METFYWTTFDFHDNNSETMSEYLTEYMPDEYKLIFQDGSYAEIENIYDGKIWGVQARGNGDSFNHMVEFEFIH